MADRTASKIHMDQLSALLKRMRLGLHIDRIIEIVRRRKLIIRHFEREKLRRLLSGSDLYLEVGKQKTPRSIVPILKHNLTRASNNDQLKCLRKLPNIGLDIVLETSRLSRVPPCADKFSAFKTYGLVRI